MPVPADEDFYPDLHDQGDSIGGAETANPPSPAESQQNDLNSAIEHLLAQKRAAAAAAAPHTSRASEAAAATTHAARRHRKLGRAFSDTHPAALSRAPSAAVAEDSFESASRQEQADSCMFKPSQALSYEDPEARRAREKLMERMGVVEMFEDASRDGLTKVESIGIIKEATSKVGENGVGRRRLTRRK